MNLPNQQEILKNFTSFLVESGLSSVSIKNYLSDVRHFLRFTNTKTSEDLDLIFQNITKHVNEYKIDQQNIFTPSSTVNRRLASIRRFTTFLKVNFNIGFDETIKSIDQNTSTPTSEDREFNKQLSGDHQDLTSKKILEQFRSHLVSENKTHSTVKNYVSDLYHFFAWTASQTPYTVHNLVQILSKEQLNAYVNYLRLCHTSSSVINRRQSSIKKLTQYCFSQNYIPTNPFELVVIEAKLSPLSWLNRLIPKAKNPLDAPKSRLAIAYHKYHSLALTPYLHLSLLVLATMTMGFLAYNQIIRQAKPSSAATSLTPPRRQLSFQGRLSDSSGTPINTSVNVLFKLWNDPSAGSQLYTSGTCSVVPDPDGVFNSLIGDGVCGGEIAQSVFADNRDVYLEVTVGAETLTPRQQIATVGYALNSETLQGYPASASATINTVPVIDNLGNINIAVASPSIISTSGNFNIKGQSISLTTATNSGGDIVLQPDALGSGQILALGGTTTEDTFRITNANLTTGALVSGYIGNDIATGSGKLLLLSSGATESARFTILADGRTYIDTATISAITSAFSINQNGSGDLLTASASNLTKFNINNSGSINNISGVAHLISDITGNLSLTSNSNTISLNDDVLFAGTTTLNSQTYTWPATSGTNTYVLQTNGSGTLTWAAPQISYWNQNNGSLFPSNSTVDFLIGGQSTASAKFSVQNINTGTPVASISANTADNATYLTGDGTLGTTNKQSLNIGNSQTGNINIGNSSGEIIIDSTSGNISFSGDSLIDINNIDIAGTTNLNSITYNWPGSQITNGILTTNGSGTLSWVGGTGNGVAGFWQRSSQALTPTNITDSVNLGSTATSSAEIHLSGTSGDSSFFMNPLAIGFNTDADPITDEGVGGSFTALQVDGSILPFENDTSYLGSGGVSGKSWSRIFLSNGINNALGIEQINVANRQLTESQWNVTGALRVGDTTNSVPVGIDFYVNGDATVSATFGVGGTSNLLGNVTIGNGTGKLDVGTIDPPYTINGEKYATYMSGMVGVKEEVTGNMVVDEYIRDVGYRKKIMLNNQEKGSDIWLFSKTTNIKENIDRMSVLLTPQGQSKTWYQIDKNNQELIVYASTPSVVSFRLTAPRFDSADWTNTRTGEISGFVINDQNNPSSNNSIDIPNDNQVEILSSIDGSYKLLVNNQEIKEVENLFSLLAANLKAGSAIIKNLVADNLQINSKLISPLADIGELNVNNATVSGTLYANDIKGQTTDKLKEQLDLLDEKYSTASAILADLQEKYSNYSNLITPESLTTSPLATTEATLPPTIVTDLLASGSIFTPTISSFDTELFIQPNGDKPVHLLANLMTLYPDGKVVVDGDLLVKGNIYASNIDTKTATISGTLALGNGQLATDSSKIIAIFNNQGNEIGSVDASGSANFEQLTTSGLVIASSNNNVSTISGQTNSNSTVGTASIATNSAEIVINNNNVNEGTLIYITPISDTNNQVLYLKSKQIGSGFTVAVPQNVNKETFFNYWLVQTK